MLTLLLLPSVLAAEPYWTLRDRLTTEFMVPGEGPGESLPATHIEADRPHAKWADTTILLGAYIGALSIEVALLADPDVLPSFAGESPRSLDESRTELAWALAALRRLDAHGQEAFPDCPGPFGLEDGFFIRDDVPADLGAALGLESLESDFIDTDPRNKEMSQDQAIHVLMGLALAERYLPPDLEVDGTVLRDEAIAIAARIGAHVAGGGEWVILNPGCEDREVERGAHAGGYSTGIASAVERITGTSPAEPIYADLWPLLADPESPIYTNSDNLHMAMTLVAVGNGFGETSFADLVTLSEQHSWALYPVLHAALYGPPDDEAALAAMGEQLRLQVEELGEGEEPADVETADHGWTTWHRYIRPDEDWRDEEWNGRRYHGVDWLLAHNLHAAVFLADWPVEVDDTASDTGTPVDAAPLPAESCGCAGSRGPATGWLSLAGLVLLLRRRPGTAPGRYRPAR